MDLKRSNGPHACQTSKGAVIFWAHFLDPVQWFLGSIFVYHWPTPHNHPWTSWFSNFKRCCNFFWLTSGTQFNGFWVKWRSLLCTFLVSHLGSYSYALGLRTKAHTLRQFKIGLDNRGIFAIILIEILHSAVDDDINQNR